MQFILTLAEILARVASIIARLLIASVAVMLVVQVSLRYTISYSFPWPEEAARYLMIWVVMLAGSLLVKDNQLVRVDFFDGLWSPKWIVYRNLSFRLLLSVMLVVMAKYGADQALFSINRTTAALQISWFWPYLAIPVGATLMLVQMAALTIREFAARRADEKQPAVGSLS